MPVVVNIQTLTTGVDWDLPRLVLARPTKSEMLYVQIVSSALRRAEDMDAAIILDHSDTQRLGFVTDIAHDQLDVGKPRKQAKAEHKAPLPIEREGCGYVMAKRLRVCPNCGKQKKAECTLMESDGALIEIKRDGSRWQVAKVPAKKWTQAERELFFMELKAYGAAHGYKPRLGADEVSGQVQRVAAALVSVPSTGKGYFADSGTLGAFPQHRVGQVTTSHPR
jgi:superfamily II DNA or RNA helicase